MRKLVIYLVDDNDIDIAVNSKLLQLAQIGDEIKVFSTGSDFVNSLKEDREETLAQNNIILLDIMMPGMTGFETIEHFRNEDEQLFEQFNIFMLSSSIDRNDIKRAEETPRVFRVLEKPLDVYQLKKAIEGLTLS
ncbi:MAG: response regulator [Flavobacteriales bacterium]